MNKINIKIQRLEVLNLAQSLDYLQGRETKLWLSTDRNVTILTPIVKDLIEFQKKLIEKGEAEIKENRLDFKSEDVSKEYSDFVTEELSLEVYELDPSKLEDEKLSAAMMGPIVKFLVKES